MKKRKKVLYVASTQNKAKTCFDGETLKSEAVKVILEKHFDVTLINLSEHKLFRTLKLCFLSLFKKYDHYVVSKYSRGANIILSIFRHFRVKKEKIYLLAIGGDLPDTLKENKKVKVKNFKHVNRIIVETKKMEEALKTIGFNNVDVLHNFKKIYELEDLKKQYPKKILRLCFFSRLSPVKGIDEMMRVIKDINKDSVKFQLDIFGKPSDNKYLEIVKSLEDDNLKYLGVASLKSKEDYKKLQAYDLHAFPTKFYYDEGVPGSIVDFLIVGVPTISSKYRNYLETIDDSDAFIYEFGSNEAMKEKLLYIYDHQEEIIEKSKAIKKNVHKFSEEYFEDGLLKIMGEK